MSGENMKAVAGMSSTAREMPLDDDEAYEDDGALAAPPHYLPIIDNVCKRVDPSTANAIKETPCFGHLWEDEAGVCPEASDCEIATHCKAVFVEANSDPKDHQEEIVERVEEETEDILEEFRENVDALIEEQAQEAMDELVEATEPSQEEESITTPGALADKPRKKKKGKKSTRKLQQKPKRGKYKGTGKYEQHGYVSMGRPVDYVVQRLEHELEYPFELPKGWSPATLAAKYPDKGRIFIAKTASYHSVVVDYKVVCRVWTNAAGYALCDLSPLLVAKLNTLKVPVEKIPAGSKNTKKYKNFEGRYYLTSVSDAENLAKWVQAAYKLKAPKPSPKKKTKKKKTMSRKGKTSA